MRLLVKVVLPATLACGGAACNSTNDQPRSSPFMQESRTDTDYSDVEQQDSRIAGIEARIGAKEKLLKYERELARARLDLAFAQRRLDYARERVRLLGSDHKHTQWWRRSPEQLAEAAQGNVERAADKVTKAERRLKQAQEKYMGD